jgi:hypothetical protein
MALFHMRAQNLKGVWQMSFYEPVSSLGQGDWTMGAGRKASKMEAENVEFNEQAQQQREAESNAKAEQDKAIANAVAEQQNKSMQSQAGQAAGGGM